MSLKPTDEDCIDTLWLLEREIRRTQPIRAAVLAAIRGKLECQQIEAQLERERAQRTQDKALIHLHGEGAVND